MTAVLPAPAIVSPHWLRSARDRLPPAVGAELGGLLDAAIRDVFRPWAAAGPDQLVSAHAHAVAAYVPVRQEILVALVRIAEAGFVLDEICRGAGAVAAEADAWAESVHLEPGQLAEVFDGLARSTALSRGALLECAGDLQRPDRVPERWASEFVHRSAAIDFDVSSLMLAIEGAVALDPLHAHFVWADARRLIPRQMAAIQALGASPSERERLCRSELLRSGLLDPREAEPAPPTPPPRVRPRGVPMSVLIRRSRA